MQCENKETTKHQPANHVRGAYLSRCVRDGAAIITDGPVLSTVTLQLLCAGRSFSSRMIQQFERHYGGSFRRSKLVHHARAKRF